MAARRRTKSRPLRWLARRLLNVYGMKRNDSRYPVQKVFEGRRRNVAEIARRVVCTLGTVAELLIAAGGDAPAQAGVVTMYGLHTGLAIVGWWVAASAAGRIVELFLGCPAWHCEDGNPSAGGWLRFPWGRLVTYALVIVGVIVFRLLMPTSCGLVIR